MASAAVGCSGISSAPPFRALKSKCGEHHEADREEQREEEGKGKLAVSKLWAHKVENGEQTPADDLSPPKDRQAGPPGSDLAGGHVEPVCAQNRRSGHSPMPPER